MCVLSVTFLTNAATDKRANHIHLQINKTADLAHSHYWPLLSSLALKFCFLCFLLQMYETRLLPHENDQITVSILLKNQSSSVIKEMVFSMCDTPAVSLLRAVCSEFDIIMCPIVWHHVFQVNHKLHMLRASFMPFMLHLFKVCAMEIVTCKFAQFTSEYMAHSMPENWYILSQVEFLDLLGSIF